MVTLLRTNFITDFEPEVRSKWDSFRSIVPPLTKRSHPEFTASVATTFLILDYRVLGKERLQHFKRSLRMMDDLFYMTNLANAD